MCDAPNQDALLAEIQAGHVWYNPGCSLKLVDPEAAEQLYALLTQYCGPVRKHDLCCHRDPGLPEGSVIVNNCAGCDKRFSTLYPGVSTVTLWEVLDAVPDLPLPQYPGLTVSVHDSCAYRSKPRVHAAVRSLLKKMGISLVEAERIGAQSVCCGDSFYPKLPLEEVERLQKARADEMPCRDVAVYCVYCAKSMAHSGKVPHHMADLVLNRPTDPGQTRVDLSHAALKAYLQAQG